MRQVYFIWPTGMEGNQRHDLGFFHPRYALSMALDYKQISDEISVYGFCNAETMDIVIDTLNL